MIKLTDILFEKENVDYDYSSTQINFGDEFTKEVIEWGNENISDDCLYDEGDAEGREDEIHITVLYGIKEEKPIETFKLLSKVRPFKLQLGKVDKFEADDYDVIIVLIRSIFFIVAPLC